MTRKILFGNPARDKILAGAETLHNAVKVTMGAKGRNVVISNEYGGIHMTKDGVSVAKEVYCDEEEENIGATMLKQAAGKTVDEVGDGTTTAVVLAYNLMKEGAAVMADNNLVNPVQLKKGMEIARDRVIEELKSRAEQIEGNPKRIVQVATVSANNDVELGKLVGDVIDKIKKDGLVTVEDSKTTETHIEMVEGMELERGFVSPYFMTNMALNESMWEDCFVLIHEKKLTQVKQIQTILEYCSNNKKAILIIAEDFDVEVLQTLVFNKTKNILKCVAIKSPAFGQRRQDIMQDIATLTGGKYVTGDQGINLQKLTMQEINAQRILGHAAKVIVTPTLTKIIDGSGEKKDVAKRAEMIRKQITNAKGDQEKDQLEKRLAKFTAGVAIVHVGAATEVELKEKRDRADDAIFATRAGIEEGIVPGAGVALLEAARQVKISIVPENVVGDVQLGYNLLLKCMKAPFTQILANAGWDYDESFVSASEYGFGPNLLTGKHENLLESGIIDPVKVTRLALENAVSVAGTFLTTECIIAKEKPTRK